MKKTLIAFAILAMSGATFAETCNGTLACSGNPTVGDNRNGQVLGNGQIANGGIATANNSGGTANGGVVRTTINPTVTTTGGTANGGVVRTNTNVTTGAATTTGGTANTASGAATTTSGAATTTGGTANTASGDITQTATNSNAGINGQGGAGGSSTAYGGNISGNTLAGGAGGSATSSSGGNTLSSSSGGNTMTGGEQTNTGTNMNTITIADNDNTVAASEAEARGNVEAARISGDAAVAAARELSDIKIRNTPSVSPAALTSSNDTCMGSASGSVNAPGIGIGIGTTYKDDNCVMLKNSRELWNMGMRAAAMALMCTDSANKEALELTGYTCPQTERDNKARAAQSSAMQAGEPTDPYVRARMGLKPLGQ